MPNDKTVLGRWEIAKEEFEKLTGKSKPKPDGKIAKAFNHTGLTKDMKAVDKLLEELDKVGGDEKKKAKLLGEGKKAVPALRKACDGYIKVLDNAIADELGDNKGEKTTYAKALKALKAQLDALAKWADARFDQIGIAADNSLSAVQKATKMVHKSLISTIANAAAAVKKVKSDPTPATFNKFFNVSDTPARKVQVQLIAADNGIKKGLLPRDGYRVDPRYVADMLTPWQAGGKEMTVAGDDEDKAAILKRLAEFAKILKLAGAFADDLDSVVG